MRKNISSAQSASTRMISQRIKLGVVVSFSLFCIGAQTSPHKVLNHLVPEKRTEVLVLATTHLRVIRERWDPLLVDRLVQELVRFKPNLIAVESMPPYVIEGLEKLGGNYLEVVKAMSSPTLEIGHLAQQFLGLSRAEAESEARNLILELRKKSNDAERSEFRRKLALRLLAAYDLPSAVLQWSYLPTKENVPSGEVPDGIRDFLTDALSSPNETYSIGVSTAKQVRLERIVSMDDHQEAAATLEFWAQLSEELDASPVYQNRVHSEFYKKSDRFFEEAIEKGDLLPFYQWLNSPEFAAKDVLDQWGLYLRTRLSSGLDRARLAQWEVRNLRMAAHIRQASSQFPGGRVLVIVGSGHKAFLDEYISSLIGVELVPLASITTMKEPRLHSISTITQRRRRTPLK